MQDHRRIRRLVRAALRHRRDAIALRDAIGLACSAITAHDELERRLLYPLLRDAGGQVDAIAAAEIEHDMLRHLVDSLTARGPVDPRYVPTFQVLGAYLDQHIAEEEDVLFTHAKRSGVDLAPLADAMLERQRGGSLTDVDLEAAESHELAPVRPLGELHEARQRRRTPGRRGAH